MFKRGFSIFCTKSINFGFFLITEGSAYGMLKVGSLLKIIVNDRVFDPYRGQKNSKFTNENGIFFMVVAMQADPSDLSRIS